MARLRVSSIFLLPPLLRKRETFDKLLLWICFECCFRLPREPFASLATSSSRNDRQTQARLLSLLCGLGESFPCIGALDTSLRAFEPCIGLPKFRFCCLLRIWKGLGPANPSTSVTLAPFKLCSAASLDVRSVPRKVDPLP